MAKMVIMHAQWITVDVDEDNAVDAIARHGVSPREPGESLSDYVARVQPSQRACEALLMYRVPVEPGAVSEEYAVVTVDGVDTV